MTTPITIKSRSLAPVFEAVVELLEACQVIRTAPYGREPWEVLCDAEDKVADLLGIETKDGKYVLGLPASREVEDVPGLNEELANLTDPNS